MASGAFAAAVPQGWTQGTRPASSSVRTLVVISSQRLVRSEPDRARAASLDIAGLRDGAGSLSPSPQPVTENPSALSLSGRCGMSAEGGGWRLQRRPGGTPSPKLI